MAKEKADFEISQHKLEVFTLYANNEIYRQVLQISLSDHDWCELQTQSCYQELLNYLDSLGIQKNTDSHIEERDLRGT